MQETICASPAAASIHEFDKFGYNLRKYPAPVHNTSRGEMAGIVICCTDIKFLSRQHAIVEMLCKKLSDIVCDR